MSDRQEALTRTFDLLGELLGAVPRAAIDDALAAARVRIVVDRDDLLDGRTQAAIYVLTTLLVRSGVSLQADFPVVPRLVDLPGLVNQEFGPALIAAVPRMFPGAHLTAPAGVADVVVAIGDETLPRGPSVIRLTAEAGRARVMRGPQTSGRWSPASGLVALAAAGLGAAEVLKDLLRPVGRGTVEVLEPLEPSFVVPFVMPAKVDLSLLLVISAGAISQQFLLTLQAERSISADVTMFDRDGTALSNSNRCPYVMIDELGQPKVEAIASYLPDRIQLTAVPRHLDSSTQDLVPVGSTIVVGADDIRVRHVAQRLGPSCLTVGATSHFLTMVTEHPEHEPCAGCAHRDLGEDIAVIPTWSIVSFWGGFLLALRVIARALGTPYPASRRVTNFWPLRPSAIFEHELAFSAVCPVQAHDRFGERRPRRATCRAGDRTPGLRPRALPQGRVPDPLVRHRTEPRRSPRPRRNA